MKILYNWLNQFFFVEIEFVKFGEILIDIGFEVEGIELVEMVCGGLEGVIVVEVLICEKYLNVDKLKVMIVNMGIEVVQVVCGVLNVVVGQKVLLVIVGCMLYLEFELLFKIKVFKICDVELYGMFCVEDELGLGQSYVGIFVLLEIVVFGIFVVVFFELENDYMIEIGFIFNWVDVMGYMGVVCDVLVWLVIYVGGIEKLQLFVLNLLVKKVDYLVKVRVEDIIRCLRYMVVMIVGVEVVFFLVWL